jgi:hypothetical protein
MEEKTLDTVLHDLARGAVNWIVKHDLEDWVGHITENIDETLEERSIEVIRAKIKFVISDVLETLACNIFDEKDRIIDALDKEREFTTEDIADLSVTLAGLLRYATKEDKRTVSSILKEVLP